MKPTYFALKSKHYSSDIDKASYLSKEDLYTEIGYSYASLIKQNSGFENTCATRMSLALIKAGVHFNGRLKIKEGPYLGRMIETGAKLLADQLVEPHIFGTPLIIKNPSAAPTELNNKQGMVFFWKITGYNGGHIDLIETSNGNQVCNSNCHFACKEVWFWPLS